MVQIDSSRCNGCGNCIDTCPQQAISLNHDGVVINQKWCTQCLSCAEACPVGAIRAVVPTYGQIAKGGDSMPYGYERGFGRRSRGRRNPYPLRHFYPRLPQRQGVARSNLYRSRTQHYYLARRSLIRY